MFKTLKWEDWLGVGLGAWLIASPFVFGFSDQPAPTMNALIMGCVLVLDEMLEIGVHETVEEWIDLVAGAWLVVAPVALGFSSQLVAAANTVLVGLLTLAFALLAMSDLDAKLGGWWRRRVTGHQ
jgi:hypothetical protein